MTLLLDSDKSVEWVPQIWFKKKKKSFCHYLSSSIIWKHQNCVFSFHYPNSKFWVFEWWKQTSKIKPNTTSFVGPTSFGWWIMKTKLYHSIFGLSKQALRAFTTRNAVLSYFTISKSYFINCTIPFYNIPNIPTFIFPFYSLK